MEEIFIKFLNQHNDFRNFIHIATVLKRGNEGGGNPSHLEIYFVFKL